MPTVIASAGERASRRFVEFFTANIRNPNTRVAYARAVGDFFAWLEERGLRLEAAGIGDHKKGPLFRTLGRNRGLTRNRMNRVDVLRMIYRRSAAAGLNGRVCCHTFRATGITAYLENGGTIEKAQQIAAHESPRTTKLYGHKRRPDA